MADTTPKRAPSDATDYSSTKAPETRNEAEEGGTPPNDSRLRPGGARGAPADPGMSSLDWDDTFSEGASSGQADDTQPPGKRTV